MITSEDCCVKLRSHCAYSAIRRNLPGKATYLHIHFVLHDTCDRHVKVLYCRWHNWNFACYIASPTQEI
jgi:hypothetical protein